MLSCLFIVALWSPAGKRASLLALLCVMFYCVFVAFPCGVLGWVWYLIVQIHDIRLLTYFIVPFRLNQVVSFTNQNTSFNNPWIDQKTTNLYYDDFANVKTER